MSVDAPADTPAAAEVPPAEAARPIESDDGRPLSQDDAFLLLQGAAERVEAARSGEILARQLKRLGDNDLRVDNLTLFNGEVTVGGDFTSGSGRGAGRSRPRQAGPVAVDPEVLAARTWAYVEPNGFADGYFILVREHLLVIAAPGGTGRDAAALTLLSRLLPPVNGRVDLYTLHTQVLGNMAWRVPKRGAGYVLSDTASRGLGLARGGRPAMTVELLDDDWLTRTGAALKEAGSYLVVITESVRGKLLTATNRGRFVLEHLDVPDSFDVVRAHVEAAAVPRDWEEVERELLAAHADGLLAERPEPRFAVKFAATVVEGLTAGEDLGRVVDALRDADEQVAEWLRDDKGSSEIALAFATAVLEESSYLTVTDAAIDLNQALSGGSGQTGLRYRRALLADHTWIELVPGEPGQSGGGQFGEVVRFRGQGLQPAVLTRVWHELDGMRPKILEWLRGLAGHPDVEVRARAAAAAGILAAADFQHALHRYLLPWASGRSAAERLSAALALGVVGMLPRHTERVWTLLRQWADEVRLGERKRLPEAAAYAVGGPLGAQDPDSALRVLRTIVHGGAWSLLEPASLSTLRLVEEGLSGPVLRALLDWTAAGGDGEPVVKSLTIFAFVVKQRAFGGRQTWPSLLAVAQEWRDELPELWGRALGCAPVRPMAADSLREWLRIVDEDWTAYPVVLDILAGLADRSEEDLKRLVFHLEQWAVDHKDPSTAAAHVYDALADAGEFPS